MKLRKATLADADLLYEWRVQGEEAPWYEGPKTTRLDHWNWLYARVHTKKSLVKLYIAEEDGKPVCGVRVDSNGEITCEPPNTEATKLALGPGRIKASVDAYDTERIKTLLDAGFDPVPTVDFYLWRR